MSFFSRLSTLAANVSAGWSPLDARQAQRDLGQYHVIDVREPHEFDGPLGHIDGAQLIPLGQLPGAVHRLDPSRRTLVVCRSGGRSARGCDVLAAAGFGEVFNLDGGMNRWSSLGLPVHDGEARP